MPPSGGGSTKRIYISLPDSPTRARIFHIHLGNTPHDLTTQDFKTLGDMTEGYLPFTTPPLRTRC